MIWPPRRSYHRSASSRESANSCSRRLRPNSEKITSTPTRASMKTAKRNQPISTTVPIRVLSHPSGMLSNVALLLVLVGLVVGAALGWLAARSRSATDVARLEATLQATRDGETRLEQSLRALSYEANAQTRDAVAHAVGPLQDALLRYERRVGELERDRVGAYEALREQVRGMHEVSGELRT